LYFEERLSDFNDDTTGHQTIIRVFTLPTVCFCSTWETKIHEVDVEINKQTSKPSRHYQM